MSPAPGLAARPWLWRWRWASLSFAVLGGAALCGCPPTVAAIGFSNPSGTPPPVENGVTYCWRVAGSVYANTLTASTPKDAATQDGCPVALTLDLDKDALTVGEAIRATWTASVRQDANGGINANTFDVQQLYLAEDRVTQRFYQILRSRLFICDAGTVCDPMLETSKGVDGISNRVANFSGNEASFMTDRLAFPSPGKFIVGAHIILPGQNPEKQRFDYAVYRSIHVDPRPSVAPVISQPSESKSQPSTASSSSGGGLSTEVIGIIAVCSVVVVAMVGIGITTLRNQRASAVGKASGRPPEPSVRATSRLRGESLALDENDFAMLSCDERLMRSLRPRGNTFLTGFPAGDDQRRSKPDLPLPFVGPMCTQDRRSVKLASETTGDLAVEHVIDPSDPASIRHQGLYVDMAESSVPPSIRQGPGRINFNDIMEDELLSSGSRLQSRRVPPAVPTMDDDMCPPLSDDDLKVSHPPDSAFQPHASIPIQVPVVSGAWQGARLDVDDLRASVDRGPGLSLSDLDSFSRTHGTRSGRSRANL
ncbi:hypothetical protein P43SY_000646 [Pythium insidiosum]|uniref:TKL protein kinase n=1 Tax=Pythium insidiosum TaxID=114742 RepID=A0AAD5LKB2_PYTIN|nr:hypothetical protein P43SY_000646 [Pythium insidiosum]